MYSVAVSLYAVVLVGLVTNTGRLEVSQAVGPALTPLKSKTIRLSKMKFVVDNELFLVLNRHFLPVLAVFEKCG